MNSSARRKLLGLQAAATAVAVELDDEHGEVHSVCILGVPVFARDQAGNARVMGIRFPRWIRGKRAK
jgi:hypothetical protein